jgi:hypothetical protein
MGMEIAKFEVLKAVTTKITVLCDMAPCSLIDTYRSSSESSVNL